MYVAQSNKFGQQQRVRVAKTNQPTCETAACDAYEACTAVCDGGCITVDADGASCTAPCLELRHIHPAGTVGTEIGGCDVEDIEAGCIDGTPSLTKGGVRGGA